MLETVITYINNLSDDTFTEKYVQYMLDIQCQSIQFELDYLKKYNKLDVLKLDKLISKGLEEAIVA